MNPLQQLRRAGQSVWLDFLRRGLVTGGLERLVREDGVSGVTSNPTIFARAIGGSADYDEAVEAIVEKGSHDPLGVFYDLALADVQMAADVLLPVHRATAGADGFVSFELEPRLARDTGGSVAAGKDLFARLGKPNVMIKVPGTPEGVPAVEELTAAGVNVNITLLFSVETYEQIAMAYLRGLERRLEASQPIEHVRSVASFFVSRVDSAVDSLLPEGSPLRGRIAIANAKLAYERFGRIFAGERWDRLARGGAWVQRPLWASTGTKNPAYSDVLYVEELIGPDTVNTMPQATMDAFRDHGRVRPGAVSEGVEEAQAAIAGLAEVGVDLGAITAQLLEDGIQAFEADLEKLLAVIGEKVERIRSRHPQRAGSIAGVQPGVSDRLQAMAGDDVVARIWRKDHTVWKPQPTEISNRLGWLTVAGLMAERTADLARFAEQAAAEGFSHALLLGMGGSSLAPEVFRRTFGVRPGALDLEVLDTTHPATIASVERSLDLSRTLFVVASKSGETVETLSHFAYFYDKVRNGAQFVAITDPGTPLERLGRERGFREVFLNTPDIGGRYSALSLVGWCRRPSSAPTCTSSSTRRRRWRAPVTPASPSRRIPAPGWVRSWGRRLGPARTSSPWSSPPPSSASGTGRSSSLRSRPASRAPGSSR